MTGPFTTLISCSKRIRPFMAVLHGLSVVRNLIIFHFTNVPNIRANPVKSCEEREKSNCVCRNDFGLFPLFRETFHFLGCLLMDYATCLAAVQKASGAFKKTCNQNLCERGKRHRCFLFVHIPKIVARTASNAVGTGGEAHGTTGWRFN